MSTSLASAALFAPDANEVLNPMITDPDAAARSISVSVISPGAESRTLTWTSFFGNCSSEPKMASTLPWTSALRIKFNSFNSPSFAWVDREDKLTLLES